MRGFGLAMAAAIALAAGAAGAAPSAVVADDQSVTLSPVALPIIVDGHIANYIFVTVKVLLKPQADSLVLRDKEPYFRDALVRAAHRSPFVLRYDYNHVDAAKLRAVMVREAGAIAGPNTVRDIAIVEQTAQHQIRSPRPGPPARP
jgi:hypothetical protein